MVIIRIHPHRVGPSDGTCIHSWRWETPEQLHAAFADAPTNPAAREAMSLTRDATGDDGRIVDER